MKFGFWYEVYAWSGSPEDERIHWIKIIPDSHGHDGLHGTIYAKKTRGSKETIWRQGPMEELTEAFNETFSVKPLSPDEIRRALKEDIDFLSKDVHHRCNEIAIHIETVLNMLY